jgi:hypothetical protein
MGGNLELVKWLVEVQDCPISVILDPKSGMFLSVQTSSSRTLIDLAMTGKPKIDILSYLVRKNLSVLDTKDPSLAPKTLQILMGAGFRFEMKEKDGDIESIQFVEASDASLATLEDAVSSVSRRIDLDSCLASNFSFCLPVRDMLRATDGLCPNPMWPPGVLQRLWHENEEMPHLQKNMQCFASLPPLSASFIFSIQQRLL